MVSAANVRRNKQKTVCEDSTWGVCLPVGFWNTSCGHLQMDTHTFVMYLSVMRGWCLQCCHWCVDAMCGGDAWCDG